MEETRRWHNFIFFLNKRWHLSVTCMKRGRKRWRDINLYLSSDVVVSLFSTVSITLAFNCFYGNSAPNAPSLFNAPTTIKTISLSLLIIRFTIVETLHFVFVIKYGTCGKLFSLFFLFYRRTIKSDAHN